MRYRKHPAWSTDIQLLIFTTVHCRPLGFPATEGSLELPSKTTPGESINVTWKKRQKRHGFGESLEAWWEDPFLAAHRIKMDIARLNSWYFLVAYETWSDWVWFYHFFTVFEFDQKGHQLINLWNKRWPSWSPPTAPWSPVEPQSVMATKSWFGCRNHTEVTQISITNWHIVQMCTVKTSHVTIVCLWRVVLENLHSCCNIRQLFLQMQ